MKRRLIVFEGIDGSGKETQANELARYISELGKKVEKIHFPLYSETFFGREVGHYLNGEFGNLETVHPKLAAMLYAGDRFEKRQFMYSRLTAGFYLICDRYVPSNIAHHSVKLPIADQHQFSEWIEKLEYDVYKIPKPDIIVFLDMPPINAQMLVLGKGIRDYTTKKLDLHEENKDYLTRVYHKFSELCDNNGWIRIKCHNGENVRNIDDIAKDIQKEIFLLLNMAT